jgi:hypothetical protein
METSIEVHLAVQKFLDDWKMSHPELYTVDIAWKQAEQQGRALVAMMRKWKPQEKAA